MDRIIRARGLHFPGATDDSMVFHEDAVLCVKDGKIVEFDQAENFKHKGSICRDANTIPIRC